MYTDEVNAKMKAEKSYYSNLQQQATCAPAEPYPDTQCGTVAVGKAVNPYSLQEEASRRAQNHYEQAGKAQSAAVFFANNPAFEDFIRLIRSGAIQI